MDRHAEHQHRSAAPLGRSEKIEPQRLNSGRPEKIEPQRLNSGRSEKIEPQKLNISFLLNDPTTEDRSDAFMRDRSDALLRDRSDALLRDRSSGLLRDRSDALLREAASSRDLRSHRSRAGAGSSRRLHVPSSVRDRIDRLERNPHTTTPIHTAHPTLHCPYCGQEFHQVSLFEEHKRGHHQPQLRTHQRTRSFVCDECGSNFSEKGNLNKKEKPWPCPHCHNNFAFRDTLNRHIDAVHLHLRPYPCQHCTAKFKKRAHLQRHISTCHRSSPLNQQ